MAINKNNSPYTAAITGCGFMYEEICDVLPLLMSPDRDALLRKEVKEGELLKIKTETTRSRAIPEFKRRFDSVPLIFWNWYQNLDDCSKRVAMFYVMLKTYKIIFDFHFNVVMQRWSSIDQHVEKGDFMIELNEISSKDEFVDSWSPQTKNKVVVAFMTILYRVGILENKTNIIQGINPTNIDFSYFVANGETWFFEACLLQPYEIESIKQSFSL